MKALVFLMAFCASLVGYVITGYVLLSLFYSLTVGSADLRGDVGNAFYVGFGITFTVHLLVTFAGSALVARRLRAPVLLTMAGTASSIVIVWFALWYYKP